MAGVIAICAMVFVWVLVLSPTHGGSSRIEWVICLSLYRGARDNLVSLGLALMFNYCYFFVKGRSWGAKYPQASKIWRFGTGPTILLSYNHDQVGMLAASRGRRGALLISLAALHRNILHSYPRDEYTATSHRRPRGLHEPARRASEREKIWANQKAGSAGPAFAQVSSHLGKKA